MPQRCIITPNSVTFHEPAYKYKKDPGRREVQTILSLPSFRLSLNISAGLGQLPPYCRKTCSF